MSSFPARSDSINEDGCMFANPTSYGDGPDSVPLIAIWRRVKYWLIIRICALAASSRVLGAYIIYVAVMQIVGSCVNLALHYSRSFQCEYSSIVGAHVCSWQFCLIDTKTIDDVLTERSFQCEYSSIVGAHVCSWQFCLIDTK
eukprot:252356_1